MGNDSTMSMFASKADFLEAELARYKAMCERLAEALRYEMDWNEDSVNVSALETLSDYKALKGE